MVVDDSAIIRGFLSRYLNEDPDIEVVTTANNGVMALRQLKNHDVEVVVLDIEMPEMDGLTALPRMIEMIPDLQVVMASTLTRKNAEVSMRSLQMGAVDYVPKPETARSVNASIDFRRELVEKVKAWAGRRRKRRSEPLPESEGGAAGAASAASGRSGFVTARRPARPVTVTGRSADTGPGAARVQARSASASPATAAPAGTGDKSVSLRRGSTLRPKVLAVGSSTGGPQALMKFFKGFSQQPDVPILITQHMPATFTSILAEHLAQATGWPAKEGMNGGPVRAGEIYVAPGGKHMEMVEEDGGLSIRLTEDPPENFCRPAVDPMLRSIARIYGDKTLVVILTGMGHDGLKGAREVVRAGGTVLAQDEASSVVWGMPGAVATAGLCTEVLPVDALGVSTARRVQGGR